MANISPRSLARALVALGAISGCADPFFSNASQEPENCAASANWLSPWATPPVRMFNPLPHPASECSFYRGGWQNFLIALQPDTQGRPALLSYPMIENVFQSTQPLAPNHAYLGGIKQAGRREIAIDQNGSSLYYAIHMNQAFADFIHANHLETAKAIQAYAQPGSPLKNLFFPAGVVEFKSAWQVVEGDPASIAAQTRDFISMQTTVPTLSTTTNAQGQKRIVEDRNTPRAVTVRLLAIHVAFTLPGHPEFIWASFEHTLGAPDASSEDDMRDTAPTFIGTNPTDQNNADVTEAVSQRDYLLYKAGTPANLANASILESDLHLDALSQKFLNPNNTPQQTSIYRMFPASKSAGADADPEITALNHNVEALFAQAAEGGTLSPSDKRGFYRLVGAQWMDKPRYFRNDFSIQNDPTSPFAQEPGTQQDAASGGVGVGLHAFLDGITTDGSDSPYSILAGEDRMSSTAMESFTQAPGGFNNCFTCHNTQAITANGIPLERDKTGTLLLLPGLLNVSHILTEVVVQECGSNVVPGNPASPQGKTVVCP